jgi:hypothetical protein
MTVVKIPRLLGGDCITMIDALNRRKLLPYGYFSNWDVLSSWLKCTFDNMPGESRVTRGELAMFKQYSHGTGPEISHH